jgi:ribosomal protein L29
MNYKDIAKKTDAELVALVREEREVLRTVRFGTGGVGSGDVKKIRGARQTIAWALTEATVRRNASATKRA